MDKCSFQACTRGDTPGLKIKIPNARRREWMHKSGRNEAGGTQKKRLETECLSQEGLKKAA